MLMQQSDTLSTHHSCSLDPLSESLYAHLVHEEREIRLALGYILSLPADYMSHIIHLLAM